MLLKRAFVFVFLWNCSAQAHEATHVISLNPCLDTILVSVADREQIAALSHYSLDPADSTIAEIASTLPHTYETAEEVMALDPDLVLTSRHSDLATRNALKRLSIRTELFNEPKTVADSFAQIRHIANLVGREERGEILISEIEDALRHSAPPEGAPVLDILVFQRNGFSTGGGTLFDQILAHTGFKNIASRYGLSGWGLIPLERVVADPPHVLLGGQTQENMPTWIDRIARHPALRRLEPDVKRVNFPNKLFNCGGPVLIQSSKVLADVRRSILGDNK
jgi:iron complex transport system substrate-binding protein